VRSWVCGKIIHARSASNDKERQPNSVGYKQHNSHGSHNSPELSRQPRGWRAIAGAFSLCARARHSLGRPPPKRPTPTGELNCEHLLCRPAYLGRHDHLLLRACRPGLPCWRKPVAATRVSPAAPAAPARRPLRRRLVTRRPQSPMDLSAMVQQLRNAL
jgi:hypothetical protein